MSIPDHGEFDNPTSKRRKVKRHPQSQKFHEILGDMGRLHDKKQADYGLDNAPFNNVEASAEWGVKPWVGALIRATDKVRRLQKFAQKGKLANESVEDAFLDLAVYAVIGLVLHRESQVLPKSKVSPVLLFR